jgi:hypothetical protein
MQDIAHPGVLMKHVYGWSVALVGHDDVCLAHLQGSTGTWIPLKHAVLPFPSHLVRCALNYIFVCFT